VLSYQRNNCEMYLRRPELAVIVCTLAAQLSHAVGQGCSKFCNLAFSSAGCKGLGEQQCKAGYMAKGDFVMPCAWTCAGCAADGSAAMLCESLTETCKKEPKQCDDLCPLTNLAGGSCTSVTAGAAACSNHYITRGAVAVPCTWVGCKCFHDGAKMLECSNLQCSKPPAPTPIPPPPTPNGPWPTPSPPAPTPSTDPGTPWKKGHLTMWATNDNLIGAQCEYANSPVNSITDPVLPKYLRSGFHCAIGDSNPAFGKGEHCGKCYELVSTSDTGTGGTPGKASSAVIMVSNGGAGGDAHFDCIMEGFYGITTARTGIFDVKFRETPCSEVAGPPVAINWADKNAYYCKMMFENIGGWGSLEGVRACIDGTKCQDLQRFAGATWSNCPQGTGDSITFEFTQTPPSGTSKKVSCSCPGSWPWDTGYRCKCQQNF